MALSAQAARGYVTYEGNQRLTWPGEHAIPRPTKPARLRHRSLRDRRRVRVCHRHHRRAVPNRSWGRTTTTSSAGASGSPPQTRQPGRWIPALHGVEANLRARRQHRRRRLWQRPPPCCSSPGLPDTQGSITAARKRGQPTPPASPERHFQGGLQGTYDHLFDCLHDMGGTRPARGTSPAAPRWATMWLEPFAGDDLSEVTVEPPTYGFSTPPCTPSSLSQDIGAALGAQGRPSSGGSDQRRVHQPHPSRRDTVHIWCSRPTWRSPDGVSILSSSPSDRNSTNSTPKMGPAGRPARKASAYPTGPRRAATATPGRHLLIVEFASYEQGRVNS